MRLLFLFIVSAFFLCPAVHAQTAQPTTPSNLTIVKLEKQIEDLEIEISELKTNQASYNNLNKATADAYQNLSSAMTMFTILTGTLLFAFTVIGLFINFGLFEKIRKQFEEQDVKTQDKIATFSSMMTSKQELHTHNVNNQIQEEISKVSLAVDQKYAEKVAVKIEMISRDHESDVREIYKLASSLTSGVKATDIDITQFLRLLYFGHGIISQNLSDIKSSINELKVIALKAPPSFKKSLLSFIREMHSRGRFSLDFDDIEKPLNDLCKTCNGRLILASTDKDPFLNPNISKT